MLDEEPKKAKISSADKASLIKVILAEKGPAKAENDLGPKLKMAITTETVPKQPEVKLQMIDAEQDSDDEVIDVKPLDAIISPLGKSATDPTTTETYAYPLQPKHSLPLNIPGRDSLMLNSEAKPTDASRDVSMPNVSLEGNVFVSELAPSNTRPRQ